LDNFSVSILQGGHSPQKRGKVKLRVFYVPVTNCVSLREHEFGATAMAMGLT